MKPKVKYPLKCSFCSGKGTIGKTICQHCQGYGVTIAAGQERAKKNVAPDVKK